MSVKQKKISAALTFVQILLGLMILGFGIASFLRLRAWNSSSGTGYDAGHIDTSRLNTEVQDMVIPLSPERAALTPAGSSPSILFLGGNPLLDGNIRTGIAGQIAEKGKASVYTAAFPDSRVTCASTDYAPGTADAMDDVFNLYYVVHSLVTGDFSALRNSTALKTDPVYRKSLKTLQSLTADHLQQINMVVIMYDAADFNSLATAVNAENPSDITTYAGSLRRSAEMLQAVYPHLRVVFMSPTYQHPVRSSGKTFSEAGGLQEENPVLLDLGKGSILDYNYEAGIACTGAGISYIDNFGGSVNAVNYPYFLTEDNHLNDAGCSLVADHFVHKILLDEPEEYLPPVKIPE